MKLLVLLGVAAAGVVVGVLLASSGEERGLSPLPSVGPAEPSRLPDERPGPPDVPASTPPPAPALSVAGTFARVQAHPRSAASQKELAAFARACIRLGPAVVGELAAFLRTGADLDCGKAWRMEGRELVEYPSFRAACLEALCAIREPDSTAALRDVLASTRIAGEGYLAALALAERHRAGWAGAVLRIAREEDESLGARALRARLVDLAAASDPLEVSRQATEDVPRGKARGRPQILLRALSALPLDLAVDLGTGLLDETQVTERGKRDCAEGLLARTEPEAWEAVRQVVERAGSDADAPWREHAATSAARSPAFAVLARAHREAAARGAHDQAAEHRAAFEALLEQAAALLRAVYGPRAAEADEGPAKEAARLLEEHRSRIPGR